jgi:nitrite reductase (NADH) small subunit
MTLVDQKATWLAVCSIDDLLADRGVCALVGPYQVAIFRLSAGSLYALSNYDPFSRAYVLSRGIVGSKAGIPKVVSPVYKQGFDLRTGQCLEDPSVAVMTFPVRAVDGRVEIRLP